MKAVALCLRITRSGDGQAIRRGTERLCGINGQKLAVARTRFDLLRSLTAA